MPSTLLLPEDVVLFQGDSITNAHRMPDEISDLFQLGAGYAAMTAARLRHDRPCDGITFINRGVSGNSTVELLDRWQADCLDLRPTVLSLLIGINDSTAHSRGTPHHGPADYRERLIRMLDAARRMDPDLRLILLEPFMLVVDGQRESQRGDLVQRQAIVAELATRYDAVFVPLQAEFDRLAGEHGPAYWVYDGIHPSGAGHRRLADAWLEAVGHRGTTLPASAVG